MMHKQEEYHHDDETELESDEQQDPTESFQVSAPVQMSPSSEKMDEEGEYEDDDDAMNADLKALLENKMEDVDLEAKIQRIEVIK